MAATLVRPTQDRRIDTTPRARRYRWHAPRWMRDAAMVAVGTALLWALYVGLWGAAGR